LVLIAGGTHRSTRKSRSSDRTSPFSFGRRYMRATISWVALLLATAVAPTTAPRDLPPLDQFGVRLDADEIDDLRRGRVVVQVLDGQRPSELALVAASRIAVQPEQFLKALQHTATL
jgi:hypothetical protein